MKKIILTAMVAASVIAIPTSCKKKGCMDPEAINYDAEAEKEDKDEPCEYKEDTVVPTPDTVVVVTDNGSGTGTTKWTKDKTYILNGRVFVNSGQTLTIEAGTVIKGETGTGESASALIVAQGGKIMAEGTASMPIIFTAKADPTYRNQAGVLQQSTALTASNTGLWGGLIVLGKAGLNSAPGTTNIEGIPTSESRGIYGGTDDTDNSGVIKYVSVRHGGANIGANNEINGITFGGVGSGTTVDYVEVYANSDDGIEFFGGTVNVKHALVYSTGDDSFDYDEGFRGKGQYWVSINPGDRHGEHDGGTSPEDGKPYATPTIYNATYLTSTANASKLTFRDNAGGIYANSFLLVSGIDVEKLDSGEDSEKRLVAGDLQLKDNVVVTGKIVDSKGHSMTTGYTYVYVTSTTDPGITTSNPVPAAAVSASGLSGDSFIDNVTYKGAFGGSNWATGWTRAFN